MTYSPTIPQALDLLSQSQPAIQANFQQANAIFGINHVNYDNSLPAGAIATDRGKHVQIVMKIPNVTPPITTADEGSLYIANSGGVREQLRYRRESNGLVFGLTEWMGGTATFVGATGAISQSFNVAGIVRTAVGRYTITFTTALVNANYGLLISPRVDAANSVWSVTSTNHTVNGFGIRVKALNDTYQDPTSCTFLVIGEIT